MFKKVAATLSVVLFAVVIAQVSSETVAQQGFTAGKDYVVIDNPVRTSAPDKIEVTEVFWYGCGHCNNFRPVFAQWKQQAADDVAVVHSPAMWNGKMKVHAQIFYTAKALGLLETMHKDIFDAMHVARKKLLNEKEIYALFAQQGVDEETFKKTFKSFGVKSQVQQADARARGYGVTSTPTMVVNGKYLISPSMSGSHANMLRVAEFLIQQERSAMAK